MKARAETQDKWSKRVEEWRTSGEPAAAFARSRGYSGSSLLKWSSHFGQASMGFAKLVRRAPEVVRRAPEVVEDAGLVVEVGRARVRVKAGFDKRLLSEVVSALGGGQ
jgi:transposase